MRAVEKKKARGSLRWIRSFVNDHTSTIDQALRSACDLKSTATIEWSSPLANDEFAEYRDQDFLHRLKVELPKVTLSEFWPNWGPQWDALARASTGEVILVEAKANIPEIVSSGTGATPSSKEHIERSLAATKSYLGISVDIPWSGKLYQYANRIAHLHLLRDLNQIPTYMVFIYFVGDEDVNGPNTVKEWKAAIAVVKGVLGLDKKHKLSKYVKDVYLDVRTIPTAA